MKRYLIRIFEKIFNIIMARLCQNWVYLTRNEIRYAKIHFSQYGEDIYVAEKLKNKIDGIYCDIGAFDPELFSNTLLLNKQGWRGINIDLDIDKIEKFKKARPKDISLQIGISSESGKAFALEYEMPVLNRVTNDPQNDILAANGDQPISIKEIEISTLNNVLAKYPEIQKINFLNIDCEGYEEKIISGFNFKKYKPDLIGIEFLNKNKLKKLTEILQGHKYTQCGELQITAFFEKENEST